MIIRPGIELANLTDTGCVREENQDYYGYAEPEPEAGFLAKGRLAVIADGMGGHEGGQAASGLAVETIRRTWLASDSHAAEALVEAFREANAAIRQYAGEHPGLQGMGTTCTAIALEDHLLYFGHVGDSRLYLVRDTSITRLTEDHSYVNRLLREGLITAGQAAVHPERNVLTAAMGMEEPAADFSESPIPLEPDDVLVLSTDGLHGLVEDGEILDAVRAFTPREACLRLVELARQRGGFDNITVQILRIAS